MTIIEIKPMSLDLARIRESKLIEEGFRLNSSAKSEDDLRLGEFMKWEVMNRPGFRGGPLG